MTDPLTDDRADGPLRPTVPSPREVAAGIVAGDPGFAAPPRAATTDAGWFDRLVVEQVRTVRRGLDVRDVVREHGARPLLVLGGTGFVQGLAGGAIGVNFLRLRDLLNLTNEDLVLLGVLSTVGGTLLAPLLGFLADRVSRVRLSMFAAFAFGTGYVAFGFQRTLFAYAIATLGGRLLGGFTGILAITGQPLLADYYPPKVRGRVFAVPGLLGTIGGAVSPLIAAISTEVFGTFETITAFGIAASLAGFSWLLLKEPTRGRYDRLELGASDELAATAQRPPGFVESYRAASSIRTLRRLWAAAVFNGVGGQFITPLVLVILGRLVGTSPLALVPIIIVQQVATGTGYAYGGSLVDRLIGERPGRVMVALGGIQIFNLVALLILGITNSPYIALPFLAIQPFVSAVPQTARDVLMSLVIPARIRGFGLRLADLWGLLGLLVVPILFSILRSGDAIRAAFLIAAPLLLVGSLILITASVDVEKDMEAARQAVLAEQAAADSRSADSRSPAGGETMIVCRKVDVAYDGVQVLFGVDLDVRKGEVLALLGTNGAGKSTILRAIAGLAMPSGGAIVFGDRDITNAPAHDLAAAGIVLVPGGKGVFADLSVADNLKAASYLNPSAHDERRARALALFPRLAERLSTPAGALSGGEQQMVALAQALMMSPTLLLIDELSLGLAPAVVEELLQAVEAMRADGMTIVLVEQSVNIALTVADRAIFMEKGQVRFEGPTHELRRRPDILRSVYLKGTGGTGVRTSGARTMGDDSAVALEVDGIVVTYGGIRALDGASLRVRSGEVVGIVGPNGAGKTTLLDVISGFTVPDAGSVHLFGKDITVLGADARARLGLGRSFQDARLFGSLTVAEALQVAMERQAGAARSAALAAVWAPPVRRAEREQQRRAAGLIELLGLGAFRDAFVSELSTGSRRVVDLACVLACGPEMLLLDEPAAGIAQAEAEELPGTLERIRRETGCGMLVIEHDVRLLTTIADRLVGMVLGATIVDGPADEVLSDPTLVTAYLGTSERAVARTGDLAPPPTAPHQEHP